MANSTTVLVPTGASEIGSIPTVQRPRSLNGLRVALLDNGKEFSDIVLDALATTLKSDYGVTDIKFWRKGFPAKGAPFIDEMAAESDVAVSGVGHCGSSSPWSVIDAVNLEKAGVPTVALISRSFCPLGQIVGRGVGHQALPIVMLPHPIGEADESRVAQKGIDAAAECVRLLTMPAEKITAEYADKKFPLPEHAVVRS
jgi:hypothetical protein